MKLAVYSVPSYRYNYFVRCVSTAGSRIQVYIAPCAFWLCDATMGTSAAEF